MYVYIIYMHTTVLIEPKKYFHVTYGNLILRALSGLLILFDEFHLFLVLFEFLTLLLDVI